MAPGAPVWHGTYRRQVARDYLGGRFTHLLLVPARVAATATPAETRLLLSPDLPDEVRELGDNQLVHGEAHRPGGSGHAEYHHVLVDTGDGA